MTRDRVVEGRAFLAEAGWSDAAVTALRGDASTRRYYRVLRNGRSGIREFW